MRKIICIAIVALSVGCGKSAAQKQAEEAADNLKKAANAVASAAEKQGTASAAQGTNDLAKAMAGMAAAMNGGGNGKTVDPVASDVLKATLPSVSGWEMGSPETQRMTSPVAFSQVQAQYKQGDKSIDVKVVDSGYAQMLIAPWAMFLASGYSRESNDGYEKATTINGEPGFEKWQKENKRGELNAFVGKRFLVSLEGDELADTKVLHDFASKMDFGKIANLK
jgi:hypothetical protein